MAQPDIPAANQPTWQQEQRFGAPKNLTKNHRWQKFDVHANRVVDDTSGPDSPARLAPSPLHQVAPFTPAPSESAHGTPFPNGKNFQHHPRPLKDHRSKPEMVSRYVPPHVRKKQRKDKAGQPDSADLALDMKALDLEGAEPSQAQAAQPKLSTVNNRPKAPLSPPSSPAEQQAQMNATWGFDEVKPKPPPQVDVRRKGRHVWPKNRDMKPVSDDEDEGGVECRSDSNGDPDYDVKKLVDWNGDWIPPPESWAARHAFTDRHFGSGIEKWINGHDTTCTVNLSDLLTLPDFLGVEVPGGVVLIDGVITAQQTINKEIAPRSWIPTKIEGDAPQSFWHAFPTRAPSPLSDIDITENRPFWEEYSKDNTESFLNPLQHPDKPELDFNDAENSKPGARKSATQHIRAVDEKNQARKRRRLAKQNRERPMQEQLPRDPGYRPTSNVYLRPVIAADAKGIQELYNQYVDKTISAPEFTPRSRRDIVERIRTITDEGLPYIVAVHKGLHPRGPQDFVNEHIVGIAYIDDFVDRGSMYRFSFELECYIHPDFVRQNIAKCLFDRILEMVNTSYPAKGGYEWINRGEYLKHGSSRVVKVINCNVPHEEGDDMVWMTDFMRKFKFRKAGHLFKMGYKYGKIIDVTIYQHETSEIIDSSVPPLQPL
ncbi:hypothetical protein SLS60_007919 [Paraconiothyrium brasiliense]|uniref:N-acetyltransferase domain-containing protein n=1 Tax=Paraconiothyrium brasiliense TaxID=300254 RepID=A0ABR3R327_9PLEO